MCGGGGGGDGGAAQRKADEDARVAAAIAKINEAMGVENPTVETVDQSAFYTTKPAASVPANYNYNADSRIRIGHGTANRNVQVFDQAGYDAAVDAANSKAQATRDAFAKRAALYDTISKDVTSKAMVDLEKERAITERNLAFDLARNGLTGGSRDIDSNRDVLDTFQQGVLRAKEMGNTSATNARAADDNTRIKLINSVRAGLDQGSAVNQAYAEMRNNSTQAMNDASASNLVGFFDRLNNQYRQYQYDQGVRNGSVPQSPQQRNGSTQRGYNGSTGNY
jgi:hypothetical protein